MNINSVLKTDAQWASFIVRVPAGIIFAAHGAQKVLGWFGGYGLDATGQYMASQGLEPGYLMALLVGSAELFGGLALIFGLLVRLVSAVLAFAMIVAIAVVHGANGLFLSAGGYEFALSLLAISTALVLLGGGAFSLDRWLSLRLQGES